MIRNTLRKMRFHQQLTVILIAVIAILTLPSSIIISYLISNTIKNDMLNQGENITLQFSEKSKLALLYGSSENARVAIKNALGFPGVTNVNIYDSSGQSLLNRKDKIHLHEIDLSKKISILDVNQAWIFLTPVYISAENITDPFEIKNPNPERLGFVSIEMSHDRLIQMRNKIFATNILFSIFLTTVILVCLALVTRRVTNPVKGLAELMQKAAKGERGLQSRLTGSVDIIAMQKSFNHMIVSLEKRETEVTKAKDEAERHRRELMEEVHFTQQLFANIPMPIFFQDVDGCYKGINRAWELFFDLPIVEVHSKKNQDIYQADKKFADELDYADEIVLKSHSSYTFEYKYLKADNTNAHIIVTKSVFTTQDGSIAGIISAIADITEQKVAEKSNQAKSLFLANMSHELRTPLNSVIVLSELLSKQLRKREKEFASIIHSSATHLLGLINNVLDFAQIESGNMRLAKDIMNLKEVCQSVKDILTPQLTTKNIHLDLEFDRNLPELIVGDDQRLRQILINIVGNSVKFTERGMVKLSVLLLGISADKVKVKFEIQDTGVGIAEKDRQVIFDKFSQVDGSITRDYGGTGLGLAITKQICNLMGGDIGLNSKLGVGSTFWLVLDFDVARQEDYVTEDNTEITKQTSLNILVAEDDEINRYVIEQLLVQAGHCPTLVADGVIALEALNEQPFELVILDFQMPNMSGLEVAQNIRRQEKEKNSGRTPIIILTADATKQVVEECSNFVDGVETKPILPDKLNKVINNVVGKKVSTLVTGNTVNMDTTARMIDISVINGIVAMQHGQEFLGKLVKTFKEVAGEDIERLKIDIRKCKVEDARKKLHKLRGSAKSIGAEMLFQELDKFYNYNESKWQKNCEKFMLDIDEIFKDTLIELQKMVSNRAESGTVEIKNITTV